MTSTTPPATSTPAASTRATSTPSDTSNLRPAARPTVELVRRKLAHRHFAVLGSTSAAGRPHAAAVLYATFGDELFVSTLRSSRKARNVAATSRAFISVPVRRLPFGPPATIQWAASAEVLAPDDPLVQRLAADGSIKGVTSHGELDLPDGCFLRVHAPERWLTYGLGLSLYRFITDPLAAGGAVDRPSYADGSPNAAVRSSIDGGPPSGSPTRS